MQCPNTYFFNQILSPCLGKLSPSITHGDIRSAKEYRRAFKEDMRIIRAEMMNCIEFIRQARRELPKIGDTRDITEINEPNELINSNQRIHHRSRKEYEHVGDMRDGKQARVMREKPNNRVIRRADTQYNPISTVQNTRSARKTFDADVQKSTRFSQMQGSVDESLTPTTPQNTSDSDRIVESESPIDINPASLTGVTPRMSKVLHDESQEVIMETPYQEIRNHPIAQYATSSTHALNFDQDDSPQMEQSERMYIEPPIQRAIPRGRLQRKDRDNDYIAKEKKRQRQAKNFDKHASDFYHEDQEQLLHLQSSRKLQNREYRKRTYSEMRGVPQQDYHSVNKLTNPHVQFKQKRDHILPHSDIASNKSSIPMIIASNRSTSMYNMRSVKNLSQNTQPFQEEFVNTVNRENLDPRFESQGFHPSTLRTEFSHSTEVSDTSRKVHHSQMQHINQISFPEHEQLQSTNPNSNSNPQGPPIQITDYSNGKAKKKVHICCILHCNKHAKRSCNKLLMKGYAFKDDSELNGIYKVCQNHYSSDKYYFDKQLKFQEDVARGVIKRDVCCVQDCNSTDICRLYNPKFNNHPPIFKNNFSGRGMCLSCFNKMDPRHLTNFEGPNKENLSKTNVAETIPNPQQGSEVASIIMDEVQQPFRSFNQMLMGKHKSGRMSSEEKRRITSMLDMGYSVEIIAKELQRNTSTISKFIEEHIAKNK